MDARGDLPEHLLVGSLGKPHGVEGELFVVVHSDDPERFAEGGVVYLADDLRPLTVSRFRHHTYKRKPRTLVTFEEVADREGADEIAGSDLVVPVEETRELSEGEFWDHELTGCVVRTLEGEEVGRVTDVLHAPANDVLVVDRPGGEALVPLVEAVVREVDVGAAVIVIDPIPGLLDDEE